METIDELTAFLSIATVDGILGRLLYRGAAWSLMREDGELPPNAPPLGATIETDLAEHGFALLRGALALRTQAGSSDLTSKAFERAANAFEALVRNGDPEAPDRGFRRTIAAAAYHLAGFSAVAYSLFSETADDLNASPGETAVRHLILRDLGQLRGFVREWLDDADHGDEQIAAALKGDAPDMDEVLSTILNTTICRALAFFDFALETGEPEPIETARGLLGTAVSLADNAGNVPLWWISNLCRHLIDDLWQHSLHEAVPTEPPAGTEEKYPDLRRLFISSLYARKTSEVELWPSQREAAQRSTDVADDLVVALPTSAGKTRVAEIAALMTLSSARRVLIVTPLRALSAQTERSFRKTFAPLGFSVSSLYGASGLSSGDEDALRTREIIIATPEKLDFALRSDPTLIDDVGLIVLDEGHMIGPSEREIRYETLVQRLLRRTDAGDRRIICLSAILPSGDELDDLTAWIRSDEPGEPVRSDWRPTRQRFGALIWRGKDALLRLDLDDGGPFLDKFVVEKPPRGKEKKSYPRKNSHLALFAAWEFASQGKRTLIFSTQANWVESYGKQVVDLCERGYLDSLLEDEALISRALEVGKEWLGEDHPAVACLKQGVAIHHGRLPSPFLRELESLLSEGVLKVIVASPTLSQGLNLNAAVLLVPALYRASEKITGEEFANVAGRAGRAFVDVEGLIVHVMFDKIDWRKKEWGKLVASAKARTLKSGLIQIVAEILDRLSREGVLDRDDAWEYLSNSREAWRSPEEEASVAERLSAARQNDADVILDEDGDDDDAEEAIEEEPLSQIVERLDATVFGLIEALDSDRADLPKLLDEALKGSLWARQIAREDEDVAPLHKQVIEARADLIWKTTTAQARRGHFAMGVGLEAGLAIDAMADVLTELIDRADEAALSGDIDGMVDALGGLGERLLFMRPFIPNRNNALPSNWKAILRSWVSGEDVSKIGPQNMRVVEEAFTYRLVWALEAIRTRRMSLGGAPDTVAGGGAAALETGVPQFMMAMLIRAGLPSRRAAIAAIDDAKPAFVTPPEMRAWLESDEITAYTDAANWPTPDTAALWARFRTEALSGGIQKWFVEHYERLLDTPVAPNAGLYRIVTGENGGKTWLMTPDYQRVAAFKKPAVDPKPSLFSGRLGRIERHIIPLLGTRRVKDLTKAILTKAMRDIMAGKTKAFIKTGKVRGRANVRGGPGTASRTMGLVGGILTYAVDLGVIDVNPVHGIKRPKDNVRSRRLTDAEYRVLGRMLKAAAESERFETGVAIIRQIAMTGCRRGEIINLKWCDVDIDGSCLRLSDSKEGRSIRPIGLPVVEFLESHQCGDIGTYVFPGPRGQDTAFGGLPNQWDEIFLGSPLEGVTPHVLRHSFASVGNDLGFTEVTIAALMGHAKGSVTSKYIHVLDAALIMAADTLAGYVEALLDGKIFKQRAYALDRSSRKAALADFIAQQEAPRKMVAYGPKPSG